MTLTKLCWTLAFWFTLLNLLQGWWFGTPLIGLLVALTGDALILGLWCSVKVQVRR